jgi:two-component system LytT family response regulator
LELLDNPPAVIFTTAFDAFALKAFDAHAVDYLLKPFSKTRFAKSLEKFFQLGSNTESLNAFQNEGILNQESASRVVLKVKNEIKIIPVNEIKYLEANDDYVNIYTKEGKFLKNKTLSFYEKSLESSQFVRVHRSYLVNISEITKIEPYEKEGYLLKLRGGESIPVSKSGLPKLKAVLGI